MKEILKLLKAKFKLQNVVQKRDNLLFFTASLKEFESIILFLKEFGGYNHLSMISAVDYIEDEKFQLTYIVHNYENKTDIGIRVLINRNKPVMVSIDKLWAGAAVYQREIHELYGIDFPGSPRLEESFVLEGWDDIPPMRKDFDTKKYTEETYFPREGRSTQDPTKIMEDKLYPVEAEVKHGITKQYRSNQQAK